MQTEMFLFTCCLFVSLLAKNDAVEPCESPQYLELGETGTIQCNFSAGFFGIFWYNTTDYINEYSVLNLKESGISGPGYDSGEFGIHPNGSLIITKVNLAHNRNFTVVKLDSAFQEVVPHFVTVVVQAFPYPPYPIIEGCHQQRSCAIKVTHHGNLKCSVFGIHPRMDLAWKISHNKSSLHLMHTRQHETTRADGRFDVQLVSEFHINNTSEYSQTVECMVVSTEVAPTFDLVSTVFLLFPEATKSPIINPTDEDGVTDAGVNVVLIILIVVIVLVAAVVGAALFVKMRARAAADSSMKADPESKQETQPLLKVSTKVEKVGILISKLQEKYKEIYHATQPIPQIRSQNKNKTNVFIESELQSLNFSEGAGKHGIWERVESVESVLSDPAFISKKLILEGDHGYVKSTIGVELAFDWCSEDRSSFMKEFEVLIYLKLSQLSDTSLTFNDLSTMLFGNDSKIGGKEMEDIIACSTRVGVLLDGFNYFSGGEHGDSLDVVKLISSLIFKPYTVVLISTPPWVANIYHFGKIKRLRVIGTAKQTRDEFITAKIAPNTHDSLQRDTVEEGKTGSTEGGILARVEDSDSVEVVSTLNKRNGTAEQEEINFAERDTMTNEERDSDRSGTGVKEMGNPSPTDSKQQKDYSLPMDLLEIPLFFSILSQIAKKNTSKLNYESITKVFSEMIAYLEHETKDEESSGIMGDDTLMKPKQQILHRIAFESITYNKKQTKFWNKEQLSKEMGNRFYESCRSKGYFIEEGIQLNDKSEPNDVVGIKIHVRFSSTFFCEWFAAHHIHHMKESKSSKKEKNDWEDLIIKLISNDYWYCLRFLCGLSEEVAEKVLKLAKHREEMHFFCALEKSGGIVNKLDIVKQSLSKDVHIKLKDSKLEQMSVIQLLLTKARNQIPIQHLFLEDSFNGPCPSSNELILRSGLELPILDTLVKFDLIEEGRKITEQEAEAIFHYSLQCNNLKHMKFSKCLLPRTLSGLSFTGDTKAKNLEVKWKPQSKLPSFVFDFDSQQWKNKKGDLLTEKEFDDVVKNFHNLA